MLVLFSMIRTLKILISLFLIFALHRYHAWVFLSEQYGARHISIWREILTGLFSDAWVAGILTLPLWVFEYFSAKRLRFWQKLCGAAILLTFGILTAGHQSYVEFFKFQIIPFHLSYLVDTAFVSSNGSSIFNASSASIFFAVAWLAYWSWTAKTLKNKTEISKRLMAVLLILTIGHALNIRWRVNWYVIEPLQANYLESLYSNLGKKPHVKIVTSDEQRLFADKTGQPDLLWMNKPLGQQNPAFSAIKSQIRQLRSQGKPIILGLIVAESLRASDVGPRTKDGATLTSSLDQLQELGTRFTNVYSTGPVTRGGQEAVWCGTPSATDTSLMRSFPNTEINCLPKIFQGRRDIKTLWAHGGDERFDSQLNFWTHQGVSRFLTKSDFPENAPATSWGISDLALFDRSASVLEEVSKTAGVDTVLAMILTVTNHIPWALPDDASIETKSFVAPHPAHRTIRYFDESLYLFISNLKEKGLWDRSVFIITGDHGNLELPWKELYHADQSKWERLLSHVSVTLTGGVIERLRAAGRLPAEVPDLTSQSQIASFLQGLASKDNEKREDLKSFDAPLFQKSPWVVSSDLNQYLFIPSESLKLPKEDVLSGKVPQAELTSWLAAVRYRGWLQYLYSSKKN